MAFNGGRELASPLISLTIGILIALVGLGVVAINAALEELETRQQVNDNAPIVIHMHATLRIVIDGEQVIIPKNVGIDPLLYNSHALDRYGIKDPKTYPVHTHDTSGVIHIESTEPRTFTLGQFFDVWGERFDEGCILDRCNDSSNKVRMFVGGTESFEFGEHVLKDGELITIVYGSLKQEGYKLSNPYIPNLN